MENKICAFITNKIVTNVALVPFNATDELLNDLLVINNANIYAIANENTTAPAIGYVYENGKFINPDVPEISPELTPEQIAEQIANDPYKKV
jgi:hypothetical protein